jgi:hypothetical protein
MNQLAPEIVSISSEGLCPLLPVQEFVVAVARHERKRIDDRGAKQATGLRLTRQRMHITSPGSRSCAPHGAFRHYQGVSYAGWPKDEHE